MNEQFGDLVRVVRRNGNVASRGLLIGRGVDPSVIDLARRRGVLEKLRRSMYALPQADIDQRRAVMLGGSVGCVSALRRVGVWGGLDPRLHVHVPNSASRLHLDDVVNLGRDASIRRTDAQYHSEPGMPRVHWRAIAGSAPIRQVTTWASDWLADPFSAIHQAVLCLDDDHAIAAIDSALKKQVIHEHDLDRLFDFLPRRLARLRTEIDSTADSGPESVVRVRLRRAGFTVETQVPIPGSSALDLVIGGVVGLDIDSRAWHSDTVQIEYDYSKTLQSLALGLPTIRILPHHIFDLWPSTVAAIARTVSDMTELRALRQRSRFGSTGRFRHLPGFDDQKHGNS